MVEIEYTLASDRVAAMVEVKYQTFSTLSDFQLEESKKLGPNEDVLDWPHKAFIVEGLEGRFNAEFDPFDHDFYIPDSLHIAIAKICLKQEYGDEISLVCPHVNYSGRPLGVGISRLTGEAVVSGLLLQMKEAEATEGEK